MHDEHDCLKCDMHFDQASGYAEKCQELIKINKCSPDEQTGGVNANHNPGVTSDE